MPIQTNNNLVMLGLGVSSDTPPNSIQPALAKGIHLRFAFDSALGFPWHGYYLFRRLHRPGRPLCLGSQFKKEWEIGPWPDVSADFAKGVFSSDVNLAFTDQFPPTGQPEFDLRQRNYLRFELAAPETAREFHVKIGFVGGGPHPPEPAKQCVDFAKLKPGLFPNPCFSGKVEFTALERNGARSKQIQIQVVDGTLGIFCAGQLSVKLPAVSSSADLNLIVSDPRTQVLAMDARGKIVDQKNLSAQPGKVQTVTLSGNSISSIKVVASKAGFHLHRVCYTVEPVKRPVLGPIRLQGFHEQVPVAEAQISGHAGDIVTAVLSADLMTSVKIDGGPAVLIDICTVPISQDLAAGWSPLINGPLCLPVEENGYPCPGKPTTFADAESMALGRIHYGTPADWGGQRFDDLHQVLTDLVKGGPAGGAMADRTVAYTAVPASVNTPPVPVKSPLDILLIGSLHPAIAMMLGLYWVDTTDQPGTAYDYMVMADHSGLFHGDPMEALAALAAVTPQAPLPDKVDVWVTFNKKRELAPPLAPPAAPEVFALPGAITGPGDPSDPHHPTNMAGLRWQLHAAPDGTLLPGEPIGYHLWRCNVGANEPTAPPSPTGYVLLTAERDPTKPPTSWIVHPIIATEPSVPTGAPSVRASDWPPFPLMAFDRGLDDGWYSYRLSAVDIFGRHSVMSDPGPWHQWDWPVPSPPDLPAPKPWYYIDPPADRQINPFAVHLLDKTPPPRPPGVEATALDPDDPMLLRDATYNAWWFGVEAHPGEANSVWLPGAESKWWNQPGTDRESVLPLRARWRWTQDQMVQAPDTAEFRIYFHPGTELPPGDSSDPLNWQDRIYVVLYHEHFTDLDGLGQPLKDAYGIAYRQYDVLLPVAGGPAFGGVPLAPSETEPVVYAHIGVSAADDKLHAADDSSPSDDPNWSAGGWGNRHGNEGLVGTPSKIYRVLRSPPPPPEMVDPSEKVWATRADYHSRSFYTFRWIKSANLKAHIFRALDDTLFQVDWERRKQGAPPITATALASFPVPSWNQATRNAIATQINGLPAIAGNASFDAATRAAYEGLSDNALRTLAGLPGNEKAFSQITYRPLNHAVDPMDPTNPANPDRIGPDGAHDYQVNPALCAYTAQFNGGDRNRYFFRAAYVNAAHTVGPLGPSSPPVYLPEVEPPRAPVITRVASGQLEITLTWAHNREPDFAKYRVYRTDDERKARDIRSMVCVATITTADVDISKPSPEWTDTVGLTGGEKVFYRLSATDTSENESTASPVAVAVVIDTAIPAPPVWTEATWFLKHEDENELIDWPVDGVVPAGHKPVLRLGWQSETAQARFVVTRQRRGERGWTELASPADANEQDSGAFILVDPDTDPALDSLYQLKVRSSSGVWSNEEAIISVAPSNPPAVFSSEDGQ